MTQKVRIEFEAQYMVDGEQPPLEEILKVVRDGLSESWIRAKNIKIVIIQDEEEA